MMEWLARLIFRNRPMGWDEFLTRESIRRDNLRAATEREHLLYDSNRKRFRLPAD